MRPRRSMQLDYTMSSNTKRSWDRLVLILSSTIWYVVSKDSANGVCIVDVSTNATARFVPSFFVPWLCFRRIKRVFTFLYTKLFLRELFERTVCRIVSNTVAVYSSPAKYLAIPTHRFQRRVQRKVPKRRNAHETRQTTCMFYRSRVVSQRLRTTAVTIAS